VNHGPLQHSGQERIAVMIVTKVELTLDEHGVQLVV